MIQKKICMLGSFAVGKTSLVSRFVKSIFSEKYHTSIGVKVDKKRLQVGDQPVTLIIWDIHGEDEFQKIRPSYLRGASGYLLVADGTRRTTLEKADVIQKNTEAIIGTVPFVLVINKADLTDEWDTDSRTIEQLLENGWTVIQTSAKTGANVEAAFLTLAEKILNG